MAAKLDGVGPVHLGPRWTDEPMSRFVRDVLELGAHVVSALIKENPDYYKSVSKAPDTRPELYLVK